MTCMSYGQTIGVSRRFAILRGSKLVDLTLNPAEMSVIP